MADKALQVVIVTPERTVLDIPVLSVRFPMFDGEYGVLPGRLPVVGRLGCGLVTLRNATGEDQYFIDGGFVQIKGPVVTLLTDRATPAAELSSDKAAAELEAAHAAAKLPGADWTAAFKRMARARKLVAASARAAQ